MKDDTSESGWIRPAALLRRGFVPGKRPMLGMWVVYALAIGMEPAVLAAPPTGRVAFVNDGNFNDLDDWAAIPFQVAALAAYGAYDRLVHWSYASDLDPFPMPEGRIEGLEASVFGATRLFGGACTAHIFNYHKSRDDAQSHLAEQINASSAKDLLWVFLAGSGQVIADALAQADRDKRQYVRVVTHHRNNHGGTATKKLKSYSKNIPGMSPNYIVNMEDYGGYDQNVNLKRDEKEFAWARDHPDERIAFLWERIQASQTDPSTGPNNTTGDISDAGMVWWWASGGPNGGEPRFTPEKIGRILTKWIADNPMDRGQAPEPDPEPMYHCSGIGTIRFLQVEGFALEIGLNQSGKPLRCRMDRDRKRALDRMRVIQRSSRSGPEGDK